MVIFCLKVILKILSKRESILFILAGVKSGEQLKVLDMQGNESTLTDSETATSVLSNEEDQPFWFPKTLLTSH